MRAFTDEELQEWLLERGLKVPIFVIKTWGSPRDHRGSLNKPNPVNRRVQVERWLRYMHREPRARVVPFPQFLASFDIRIRRRYAPICTDSRDVQMAGMTLEEKQDCMRHRHAPTSGIVQSGPYKGQFWYELGRNDCAGGKNPRTLCPHWRTVWLEDENLHWAVRDVREREISTEEEML